MINTKLKFYSFLLFIAAIIIALIIYVDQIIVDRHLAASKKQVSDSLLTINQRLTFDINNNIQVMKGLPALLSVNPSLSQQEFSSVAKQLIQGHTQLKNIAIAPDLVIKYVYPIKGNEAVLGLDFRTVPSQLKSVLKAKESHHIVLDGPLKLVQGGMGLISRYPVYINNTDGMESFWGTVSAVIDMKHLYQQSGLLDPTLAIEVAIRTEDSAGKTGDVFFGDPTLFKQDTIRSRILLPYGSWQLAAKPVGGWPSVANEMITTRLFLAIAGIALWCLFFISFKTSIKEAITNTKYRTLFNASTDAIMLADKEHFIDANQATLDLFGCLTLEELQTKTVADCSPETQADGSKSKDMAKQWIETAITKGHCHFEWLHKRLDTGEVFPAQVLLSALMIDGQYLVQATVRNIAEQKQAESALRQSEQRLQEAQEYAQIGYWDLLADQKTAIWSDQVYRLFGLSHAIQQPGPEMICELVHKNDVSSFIQSLQASFESGHEHHVEYRIQRPSDGEQRWIECRGKVIKDESGKLERISGFIQDITEKKQHQLDNERLISDQTVILDNKLVGIAIVHDRKIQWANSTFNSILGYPKGTSIGCPTRQFYVKNEDYLAIGKAYENIKQGVIKDELEFVRKDGQKIWINLMGSILHEDKQESLWIFTDITEHKKAEEKLQLSSRIINAALEGITITDPHRNIVDVNPAFCTITGYTHDEVLGKNPRFLSSGKQEPAFYQAMWQQINEQGHWKGEIWNRKKDGEIYAELLSISALKDKQDNILNYVGIFSDITSSKRQQEQLNLMAYYDVLTKLPNRALFIDRFNQAIIHSKRSGTLLALCFLDLDNFKPINDSYGHAVGDSVLVEVAQRITATIREEDTLSRQGGDEFTLILGDIHTVEQSQQLIQRVLEAVSQPIFIDEVKVPLLISASCGITLYPFDKADVDTLLRHADQAMYQAKLAGKNRFTVFNHESDQQIMKKQSQLEEIEQALVDNEFQLFYQPKVNMVTGKVLGAEALIRWCHPERGLIAPLDFLPLVDGTALENKIGLWVIHQALEQMAGWLSQGVELGISINIASQHLLSDNFYAELERALSQHTFVDSQHFQIEILETSALLDLSRVEAVIKQCHEMLGVTFALDDFGTGYSSLTHLRNLSIDQLKIDQSFVRDMLDDPNDYAIIDGTLGLAESFDRQVIAEGVESTNHGLMLLLMGCQEAQGYGIAKPMPATDFLNWLEEYMPNQAWMQLGRQHHSLKENKRALFMLIIQRWQEKFVANIQAEPDQVIDWPIMDARRCPAGIWIRRKQHAGLFDVDALAQLDQAHNEFHRVTYALYEHYQAGELVAAREGVAELNVAFNAMHHALALCQ